MEDKNTLTKKEHNPYSETNKPIENYPEYITNPIILKDDTLISVISAVYNFLTQVMKQTFAFTIKFEAFENDDYKYAKDVISQKGYNDKNKPAIALKINYIEEMASNVYQNNYYNNFPFVQEHATQFVKLLQNKYSEKVGSKFPFTYVKNLPIYAEECGYKKFRYNVPLMFIYNQ